MNKSGYAVVTSKFTSSAYLLKEYWEDRKPIWTTNVLDATLTSQEEAKVIADKMLEECTIAYVDIMVIIQG